MSDEMKKATARRIKDNRYANRWFVGKGIDIGCGYDVISKDVFSNITEVHGYDHVWGHVDAQKLPEIGDESVDFVVSSHCLEHMVDPTISLLNWLRVLKVGGYLTVTIPEWDMYEHRHWPSKFNGDHKWSWTLKNMLTIQRIEEGIRFPSHVRNVIEFIETSCEDIPIVIEMVQLLTEHYDETLGDGVDQTGGPAECAIEFILRKV